MFKKFSNESNNFDRKINFFAFKDQKRKGIFKDDYLEENFVHILFLSKRGTLRAPLACEILKKMIAGSNSHGQIKVFFRGATKVYDQCPVDYRINSYSSITGSVINGISKFANPRDFKKANFIITLDQESMDFANLHLARGYIYPFTFFRPSDSSGFVSDPLNGEEDLDGLYREIISSIQYGCHRIMLSLISSLPF